MLFPIRIQKLKIVDKTEIVELFMEDENRDQMVITWSYGA